MASCQYCGAEWKPGGDWHKSDCQILTGTVSTFAALKRRKKPRAYQSVVPLPDELPRVETLKGFEKP